RPLPVRATPERQPALAPAGGGAADPGAGIPGDPGARGGYDVRAVEDDAAAPESSSDRAGDPAAADDPHDAVDDAAADRLLRVPDPCWAGSLLVRVELCLDRPAVPRDRLGRPATVGGRRRCSRPWSSGRRRGSGRPQPGCTSSEDCTGPEATAKLAGRGGKRQAGQPAR